MIFVPWSGCILLDYILSEITNRVLHVTRPYRFKRALVTFGIATLIVQLIVYWTSGGL